MQKERMKNIRKTDGKSDCAKYTQGNELVLLTLDIIDVTKSTANNQEKTETDREKIQGFPTEKSRVSRCPSCFIPNRFI